MNDLNSNFGLDYEVEPTSVMGNRGKLWDPKWFLVISFLFSFLPAAILYSINWGRIGNTKKRNISLIISIVGFTLMALSSLLINLSIAKIAFYGLNIGVGIYLKQDQASMFRSHMIKGGQKASFLVPVIACVFTVFAILAFIIYTDNVHGNRLLFGQNELYYTKNVEKSDAQKLGDYLVKQGFFNESSVVSVKIDKQSDIFKFSLIVDEKYLNDPAFEQDSKGICNELSGNVFDGFQVDLVICDNVFKPLKTISGH